MSGHQPPASHDAVAGAGAAPYDQYEAAVTAWMRPSPAATTPRLILLQGASMRTRTLWQIDMGDGSWAVACRTCRLSYRGPKAGADLLFDTHQCEPLVPLRAQTR
jgi:hypothetical protein